MAVSSSTIDGLWVVLVPEGSEKVPMLAQLLAGDHVFLGQQLFRVEMNA